MADNDNYRFKWQNYALLRRPYILAAFIPVVIINMVVMDIPEVYSDLRDAW